jgi:hypothetical protein
VLFWVVDFSVVELLPVSGLLLVWVVVDDSEDFVAAAGAPCEPVSPGAPAAPAAPGAPGAPAGPCVAGPGASIVVLHPATPKVPIMAAKTMIELYVAARLIMFVMARGYHGRSLGIYTNA